MLWSQEFMVLAKRWLDFLSEQSCWLPRKIEQRFEHTPKGAELGPAYEEIVVHFTMCLACHVPQRMDNSPDVKRAILWWVMKCSTIPTNSGVCKSTVRCSCKFVMLDWFYRVVYSIWVRDLIWVMVPEISSKDSAYFASSKPRCCEVFLLMSWCEDFCFPVL